MSSPLLNLRLPDPIVIPALPLTGFYACMLGADYLLLKYQKKRTVKLAMTAAHVIAPLAIVSPSSPANVAFTVVPWFIASCSAQIETFSVGQWADTLRQSVVDQTPEPGNVYRNGWWKAGRGLVKLLTLGLVVQPLLPSKPDHMLNYPWLSKESLINTFLFGADAYLIFGFMDIISGVTQAITGWKMQDMFDEPYLATSRRWNKHIRNLLHAQVFSSKNKKDAFFHTTQGRALLSFLTSAMFHELIIWCVCRKVTLENFSFFALHGVACALEVKYFKKPVLGKWVARFGQLGFMILTGRLFLGPFLRHRFMEPLLLTQF